MVLHLSFIYCFLCYLLLANSTLASEIKIIFVNEKDTKVSVQLRKDDSILDSARFESQKGRNLVLLSQFMGIHYVSFDGKNSVVIYLKRHEDIEILVDLQKGKFEVINSLESQQLNRIFENWQREVAILKILKEPTFEHFDRAFDSLASEIMATQNPEIIDWASFFLIELEKDPSKYMLSLEKFIDFEQLVREKYPSYKFNKMKANFGVRKDNQSGYYWKY